MIPKTLPVFDLHPEKKAIGPDTLKALKNYSKGVAEAVNFGTHVLAELLNTASGSDELIPQLMIFRNILENLDAVSVLIGEGSIDPCKSLLRVILESILNLEYILQGDQQRNGLAFLICNYHNELKLCQKLSAGTAQYKQLRSKLRTDKTLPNDIVPPQIAGLEPHIETIKRMIALPMYQQVETEYQRLFLLTKRSPAWHQLFNGPVSIEQLANHLNREGLYEVLYRGWSGSVHGVDILKGKFAMDEGHFTITQVRDLQDLKMVTQYACSLALITYRIGIKKKAPHYQKNLDGWYKTYRDFFTSLC